MFKRALTEKAAEETDRIASSVESRGSGGGGKEEARVSKSVADGWDAAPPGQETQPGPSCFTPESVAATAAGVHAFVHRPARGKQDANGPASSQWAAVTVRTAPEAVGLAAG